MSNPNMNALAHQLRAEAESLGFSLFGIAPAVTPEGYSKLVDWIAAGYAADMDYFGNRLDAYQELGFVLAGVQSVIVLGFPYRTVEPTTAQSNQGKISRYAWGEVDYHDVIHVRLKRLKSIVIDSFPDSTARGVVDSAPIMEREFAKIAGLGWTGKNSLLLNRQHGSFFFLSCLLTTLPLPVSQPNETDHCGTCTRCLDACPTQAFVAPGVLDSRRCISYQTIENRGSIPEDLREGIGQWLFGCDVCQDVCPWNRFSQVTPETAFWPRQGDQTLDLLELLSIDETSFRERFRKTPLWRPRRRGLLRNATICLGNARETKAVDALIGLLHDDDTVLRGAAAWAIGRIGTASGMTALKNLLEKETDAMVQQEIRKALESSH